MPKEFKVEFSVNGAQYKLAIQASDIKDATEFLFEYVRRIMGNPELDWFAIKNA